MVHHHFTRDDRAFLAKLLSDGLSIRSCTRILGFHPSSVYRELVRGKAYSGYLVTPVERKSGYALVGYIPKAAKRPSTSSRHCQNA